MPELPEVEAVRRGLSEQLTGKRIVSLDLRLPKLVESPEGLQIEQLEGQAMQSLERRGKYLAIMFPDIVAVMHLSLAGQVIARGKHIPGFAAGHPVPAYDSEMPHKSTHLIVKFEDCSTLYVTDIRHFARIRLMPIDEIDGYWSHLKLGPDTLSDDFTLDYFRSAIRRRKTGKLKPLLLDQKFVAGLGNIYVDESLHRARLHPERIASELSDQEIERLYHAIKEILEIAVPQGGARIIHSKAIPDHGEFPFIHGREGLPCLNCGGTIIKTKVNNRGTYLCLACQPEPDPAR